MSTSIGVLSVSSSVAPVLLSEVSACFAEFRPLILRIARGRLAAVLQHDTEMLDQIERDVLERFAKAVSAGRVRQNKASIAAWFYCVVPRVVCRQAPTRLRHLQRFVPIEQASGSYDEPAEASADQSEDEQDSETLKQFLAKAMKEALSPRELQSLALDLDPRHEQATGAECAQILGVSEERYRSYCSTAKKKLIKYTQQILRETRSLRDPEVRALLSARSLRVLDDHLAGIDPKTTALALGVEVVVVHRLLDAAKHKTFQLYLKNP